MCYNSIRIGIVSSLGAKQGRHPTFAIRFESLQLKVAAGFEFPI